MASQLNQTGIPHPRNFAQAQQRYQAIRGMATQNGESYQADATAYHRSLSVGTGEDRVSLTSTYIPADRPNSPDLAVLASGKGETPTHTEMYSRRPDGSIKVCTEAPAAPTHCTTHRPEWVGGLSDKIY